MGAQILKVHWKASKWILLPFVVAAFGLPLATSRLAWYGDMATWIGAGELLQLTTGYAVFFPILAAAVGAIVALTAWNWDHQTGHVYPLTLPISRSRYAALKFAAGAVILMLPTGVLFIGSLIASGMVKLPVGLQTYPLDLTLRFFLASMLIYGLFFSMASGRMRTAVIVLGSIATLAIMGEGLLTAAYVPFPGLESVDVFGVLEELTIGPRGVFGIYSGKWGLIDV